MVQLPEVHSRFGRPTERSPRAQNPDAKSRGTRDNAVRLHHVESTRVPILHAAPSPPQFPDLLHRLAKGQSHRPSDFLSGHAYEDRKWEHRGDYAHEAGPVHGICGAHGVHETVDVRDIQTTGGGCGLRVGQGKKSMEYLRGWPRSFRSQRRPEDDYSPGRGEMAQDDGTRGGTFHGEMDRCRKSGLGYGMQYFLY